MKFKYSFEFVNMGDEIIMVPVGDGASEIQGVIKLNEEGHKIVQLLMQGMDEDKIVELLGKEYDNGNETIKGYVNKVVNIMKDNNIIE